MLLFLWVLTACGTTEPENLPVYQSIEDLSDKKVGAPSGGFQEAYLEKEYPEMEVLRIDTDTDLIQALLTERCDAIVMDDYIFLYHMQNVKGITTLDETILATDMGFCFGKGKNVELREQFNEFLKGIKADGTYDEICDRWINHANEAEMPEFDLPKDSEPIRIATNASMPPMVFFKNGKMVGLDVELATRFAASIGRRIEWSNMNFPALIPALVSGNQDMIASGVCITPERQLSIDFSDPYFVCNTVIGIREENSAGYVAGEGVADNQNFFETIKTSVHRNIIEEDRYLMILDGFKLTAWISLLAGIFGTLLGAFICWMRMSRNAVVRMVANIYISIP